MKEKNMIKDKSHYIYYAWFLDIRAGGPTGYLANLKEGLEKRYPQKNSNISFAVMEKNNNTNEKNKNFFDQNILKNKFFYSIYVNCVSKQHKTDLENYKRFLDNVFDSYPNKEIFSKIDIEKVKTIHVHSVDEVIKIKNYLAHIGREDIKVILTCHVPESVGLEYYHGKVEEGYWKGRIKKIYTGWTKIEVEAYKRADILIFPSYEAMYPAMKYVPTFSEIIKNKDIRFVPTGVEKIKLSTTKEEAKRKYGVSGKFVLGYLGRHNAIKGYDILKRAAKQVLRENKDMTFLVGGVQGREFGPLKDRRWVECGKVDPKDFLAAVDVFILPNKMTYYDLVLLEVMSCGIPVIVSYTGGNISVKKEIDEIMTYKNGLAGLIDAIKVMHSKSERERIEIGNALKVAYEDKFTTCKFAENYVNEIEKIHRDYNL